MAHRMASTSDAVGKSPRQTPAPNGDGSLEAAPPNGSPLDASGGTGVSADIATAAAIGIAAYIVTDLTYLAFHSLSCLYAGCQLVEIASSAVRKISPPAGTAEPLLVYAGGSIGNLVVFFIAWALAARGVEWPPPAKYFLWLVMTLNGLVAGGQILIANAFDAGDWAMMTQNWSYRILWKLLFTAVGFGIALFAFTVSRARIEIFLGRNPDQRRALLPVVAGVPYMAGGLFITATAALSVNNKLQSVAVAAVWTFVLTAWLLIFAGKPHLPRPRTPHRPFTIGRSLPWIIASAILAIGFAAVLGPGIWLYS